MCNEHPIALLDEPAGLAPRRSPRRVVSDALQCTPPACADGAKHVSAPTVQERARKSAKSPQPAGMRQRMRRGHTCASVGPNVAGVNFAASARPPAAAPHAKDVWCWCSRSYLPTSPVLEMPTCGPYTIKRLPPSGTWCAYALKPARPRTYACAQAACPYLWRDAPELPMNGIPARPPITNASPYAVRKRSGRSPCAHACTSGLAPACSLTDRLTHTSIVIPTQALFTAANADTKKHNSHDRSCPHREGQHTHAHTKANTQTHTHTHTHTRTHARKCTPG